MTSSIPMFSRVAVLEKSLYMYNCITDPDGLINKINLLNSYKWENTNKNSSDCFDVNLNHAKNNLYKKQIDLKEKEKFSDNKSLYVVNSLKMAAEYCAKQYSLFFNKNVTFGDTINIYRQNKSSMFDDKFITVEDYTIITFLNESLNSSPTIVMDSKNKQEIFPKKGSLIILSPGMSYMLGYFLDNDRYYSIYNFKTDII